MITLSKRKFLLFFLMVIVFIIILGSSYLFILNSQPFRDYLKPIIVKQLENNLGKSVHIEEIQSVSFNSLVFSNLIILENTIAGESITLLEAERVTINFRFTLSFPQFKNWQLAITQLTLQKANLNLQRDIQGDFDMVKNLNLQPEMIKNNFTFNKIYFKDSYLLFQDDFVYQIERLSTGVKNLNGFFNLNNLPEVEFEFNGLIEEDSSPIAIQGYLFIDQPLYSLSCQLENADMMHFQHYINGLELLNLEKGRFDLKLVLNSDPTLEPAKISWQGEASFQGVNLRPDSLNRIFLENAHGLIQFQESEIQINTFQGFFHNQPFHLKGELSFKEIANFNLDLKANDFPLTVLKEELEGYISETSLLLQGDISLDVNLKGNLNDFQVKGKLNSLLLNIDGWQLQNPNLLFSFKEEQLIIESLETQWEDTKIIMEGIIDWEKPSPVYKFFAKVKGLDLKNSAFKKITFLDSFSGSLSGNFMIEGTLLANSPINLTGQLTAQEVKLLQNTLKEPVTAQLEMKIINSSSFELNKLTLSYLYNQFNLYGKLNSKNQLDFKFNSDNISLEDFPFLSNLDELRGICNITGKIQGTASQPQIESRLELKNVNWENFVVDNFEGEIFYQFPFLQFRNIILYTNNISLTAAGQVDLQKDSQKQVDLKLQLSRLNMNYLTKLFAFEESLSGWAHGFADLQGNWPDISLDSQLDLEEISIKNYYLGKGNLIFSLASDKISSVNTPLSWSRIFSDWSLNNYQVTIEELSFKQAEMQINARGKVDLKKDIPFSLDIDFNHKKLNQLIAHLLPSKIEGKLKIMGNLISQQFLLNSQFSTLQDETGVQHDFKFTLEKKGSKITLSELLLKEQKGQFLAKGWLDFTQNLLDIEFQATEFDLNNLVQLIGFKEDIKGNLNITGACQGSLKRPNISTSVQIEDGYFRNFKFEDLQSKINWKEGNLEIQELIISYQKDFQIKAQGKIPFPFIVSEKKEDQDQDFNQLPLNFEVSLENTDLSFVQIFLNKNFKQAQGITNLILNLSGTVGQPIFNGHLTLNQGSLELTSIPLKLDKIETKVEIVNNLVKIPQMTFMLDNNLIYVSGDFKLVNFQPDDLRIKIWNEGGKLIYGDILTAQTNFLAEINGSIDSPQIKGEFIFSEGELNWKPGYQFIPEKNDSLMRLKGRVDLSAKILENFQFKAPNMDLKLDGEIKIQGDLPQPLFTGQLSVRKGYFVFLEQKFQFTEGKLLLNEFTGPDVLLDIKANTKVSQVTVFLKISGNLSAPQIELSSKPAL
ncbi:translocation/assembly module TamB domain-containing protein, partial [bacterium]|nr:translocation/assembly module TamB domain-containing protein [bacterium]